MDDSRDISNIENGNKDLGKEPSTNILSNSKINYLIDDGARKRVTVEQESSQREFSYSDDHAHEEDIGIGSLHPIELTAHTILNGPLDHLNEDFELLSQSQYILLTRLRLIEERLKSFRKVIIEDGNMTTDKEITETFNKIKDLKKRLAASVKTLDKVESRVERMSSKLHLDTNDF